MSTSLPSSFQPLQGYYPNNAATSSHDQPSSDDGSYAHVFIVLAIILVISVIGCVFGRLFCKGESSNKEKQTNHVRSSKEKGQSSSTTQVRHFPGNKETEDIEFGFDKLKPIPSSKIAASDDGVGVGGGGGGLVGFKPVSRNGEARGVRGYVRFAPGGDIESSSRPAPGHSR